MKPLGMFVLSSFPHQTEDPVNGKPTSAAMAARMMARLGSKFILSESARKLLTDPPVLTIGGLLAFGVYSWHDYQQRALARGKLDSARGKLDLSRGKLDLAREKLDQQKSLTLEKLAQQKSLTREKLDQQKSLTLKNLDQQKSLTREKLDQRESLARQKFDQEQRLHNEKMDLERLKMERQQQQHLDNLSHNEKKLDVMMEVARIRAGGMSTVPIIPQSC